MKITLITTGGILPLTKKAEKEVPWSEKEMKEMLKKVKLEKEDPGKTRDGITYHLNYNDETVPIDWQKIPEKYKKTFDDLKDDLKVVKPG